MDKLKKILAILEEGALLQNLLPEPSCDEVEITIGRENRLDEAKER